MYGGERSPMDGIELDCLVREVGIRGLISSVLCGALGMRFFGVTFLRGSQKL